jgi:DNA helicase-2/ATP-dependent DNA helicase PcrA
LIGDDELPGAADAGAFSDSALEKLKEKWLRSPWAERAPHRVEVPFERSIEGTILRGRMDAVYKSEDGTFDVVDWKTGSAKSGDELANAAIQLAVYRLAWAEIEGVPVEKVRAAFHYVGSEETVRPSDLLDYEGLVRLIQRVPVASSIPSGR